MHELVHDRAREREIRKWQIIRVSSAYKYVHVNIHIYIYQLIYVYILVYIFIHLCICTYISTLAKGKRSGWSGRPASANKSLRKQIFVSESLLTYVTISRRICGVNSSRIWSSEKTILRHRCRHCWRSCIESWLEHTGTCKQTYIRTRTSTRTHTHTHMHTQTHTQTQTQTKEANGAAAQHANSTAQKLAKVTERIYRQANGTHQAAVKHGASTRTIDCNKQNPTAAGRNKQKSHIFWQFASTHEVFVPLQQAATRQKTTATGCSKTKLTSFGNLRATMYS